jgi:hypothetical protein
MCPMVTTDRYVVLPTSLPEEHPESYRQHSSRLVQGDTGVHAVHLTTRSVMTLTGRISELDPSIELPVGRRSARAVVRDV